MEIWISCRTCRRWHRNTPILSDDYFDEFRPKSPTEPEKPLNEINSEEYQDHKKRLDKEQALIKKAYDRVKEKIRNVG